MDPAHMPVQECRCCELLGPLSGRLGAARDNGNQPGAMWAAGLAEVAKSPGLAGGHILGRLVPLLRVEQMSRGPQIHLAFIAMP
jgi:hypothetical protein